MALAQVRLSFVAAHMAVPTVIHFGREEMKKEWLMPIDADKISRYLLDTKDFGLRESVH